MDFTATNQGSVNAGKGNINYQIVLSDNAVITASDTVLESGFIRGRYSYVTPLAANSSKNVTHTITLPASITNGSYYLGVIIDADNRYAEADENNNTRSSALIIQ